MKANQRFTPPFDNHRNATAEAVIQCLYRYQEQLLRDNPHALADVDRVFGKVEGGASLKKKFIETMTQDEYDLRDMFDLFITASSVTINRAADQQALIQLSQIYEKYIAAETQAAMALDNPQIGENMKATVIEARDAARTYMKRILYTFQQIADYNSFILDTEAQEPQPAPAPSPQAQGGAPQAPQIPNLGGNQVPSAPPSPPAGPGAAI
jgi:hypothetical protein